MSCNEYIGRSPRNRYALAQNHFNESRVLLRFFTLASAFVGRRQLAQIDKAPFCFRKFFEVKDEHVTGSWLKWFK